MNKVTLILICLYMSLNAVASGNSSHLNDDSDVMTTEWQASADLVYRQESAPIILGFLPVNQHENNAGLKLEHFDLSYGIENYKPSFRSDNASEGQVDFRLNGQIDIAWHSNDVEIKQAWLQNEWSDAALKVGQYIPRIGFLNHQHHQGFLSTPLVNRTYWGEQMSEAGAEIEYVISTDYGDITQFANVLGGNHLNSNKDTLAFLYQIEFTAALSDDVNATLLSNYYQTNVKDRGILLFDLTSTNHSHSNSQFSEFFDGSIKHISLGAALDVQSNIGLWQYQLEYSQRQEKGKLYSDSVNLADLDLASKGSYQQVRWQGNQKKWQAGLRHNYLYSDAEVSDTNDNSLDNSRLNNKKQTPQTLDLMLGYAISSQQNLQLVFSDNIDWKEYQSRVELHYQIQLH